MAFCYEVRQLGSKRRMIHENVHLQNLNCLASLRTKVMPVQVSSRSNWRKIWQMYPSRDRQDANRSNLAHILLPRLYYSEHTGANMFRPASSRLRDFFKISEPVLEISCERGEWNGRRHGTENPVTGTSFL